MRRRLGLLFAAVTLSFPPLSPALAWWDEGHMQIAAIAYDKLDAPVKAKVDALLKLNADYDNWSHGAPDVATGQKWAFVHAACFEVRLGIFLGRRCIHQRPACISCFYRSAATDARAFFAPSAIAIWSAQATRPVTKSLP